MTDTPRNVFLWLYMYKFYIPQSLQDATLNRLYTFCKISLFHCFSSTIVIILIGICQNFFVFVMFCGGGWKTSRRSYEVYMTRTRINNNTNVSNK